MNEISDPRALRPVVDAARCAGKSIGFVPTMGYLHAGHMRLIADARRDTDFAICSIFVNPTQFSPSEDFERYPRDFQRDRVHASESGVDVLFTPDLDSIYPDGVGVQSVWIDPGNLASCLEGAARPGHLRGVATVVAKLFHLVCPDRAYFGQKDAQQALVISRMALDLAFNIDIVLVPTVRAADGLALSSRNVYLSAEQRAQAAAIYRTLLLARRLLSGGERDAKTIEMAMLDSLKRDAPLGFIDYVSVADLRTLQPVIGVIQSDVLISLAVFFGTTRLIDNTIARFDGDELSFS